ncbi:MAG: hypothetical protein WA584_23650 [Pyrinomonadaceae bacterium]
MTVIFCRNCRVEKEVENFRCTGCSELICTTCGCTESASCPEGCDWAKLGGCTSCEEETESLGPCCVCETTVGVRNVLMLDEKSPTPGRGWGCVVCGLTSDGALAVVCDACLEKLDDDYSQLKFACTGYPATDGRTPIDEVFGLHEHDRRLHEALDGEELAIGFGS